MAEGGGRSTRWLWGVLVVAVIAVLAVSWRVWQKAPDVMTVGVVQPLQHVAVDDITRGIEQGVTGTGYRVLVKNANGDKTAIPQIVAGYKDARVDIYVPIFTATAQTVKSLVGSTPVVFAAVTDPVAAGLLSDARKPEGNITGVSDLWPIASQLDLIRELMPGATRIGIVFDPGDPSSSVTMPLLREEASSRGFELVERPVHAPGEITQSLDALTGKIDLLYTANDVTVTAAFPALVQYAIRHRVPLFAGDYSSVERGAIASIGQDYYNVGVRAGEMIRLVAEGRPISSIPVAYTTGGDLYVNSAAAKEMGLALPPDVIQKAKTVYKEISLQ
jgi:putative ABC transport system substrate-binding protein